MKNKEKTSKSKPLKPSKASSIPAIAKRIKKSPHPPPLVSPSTPPKKCKRGSKFCRNSACSHMMPIHTSVCPRCGHDQKIQKSSGSKQTPSILLDRLKKKVNLIAKNLQQAFNLKKSSTYLDEFNRPSSLSFDEEKKIEYIGSIMQKKNELNETLSRPRILLNHEIKAIPMEFCPGPDGTTILNLGFPINSLAWAFTGTPEAFLAVGLSSMAYRESDELSQITREVLNLSFFQPTGSMNSVGSALVPVIKVVMDPKTNQITQTSVLYTLDLKISGGVSDLKWTPRPQIQGIGLLSVLANSGRITNYRLPKSSPNFTSSHPEIFEIETESEIMIPGVKITAFDWLLSLTVDILVTGSLTGSVFLLRRDPMHFSLEFEIIRTFYNAHSEEITDVRFFNPCENSFENPIFASASADGFLRVFEAQNNEIALFETQISKESDFY